MLEHLFYAGLVCTSGCLVALFLVILVAIVKGIRR